MARFLGEILKISCLALKHIIQIEKKFLSTVYNQYKFLDYHFWELIMLGVFEVNY